MMMMMIIIIIQIQPRCEKYHMTMLLLQLMIGNVEYHCSCVQYVIEDYTVLIVALSIAVAVLLALMILTIWLCRRRLSKPVKKDVPKDYDDATAGQNDQYSAHLPEDYSDAANSSHL